MEESKKPVDDRDGKTTVADEEKISPRKRDADEEKISPRKRHADAEDLEEPKAKTAKTEIDLEEDFTKDLNDEDLAEFIRSFHLYTQREDYIQTIDSIFNVSDDILKGIQDDDYYKTD